MLGGGDRRVFPFSGDPSGIRKFLGILRVVPFGEGQEVSGREEVFDHEGSGEGSVGFPEFAAVPSVVGGEEGEGACPRELAGPDAFPGWADVGTGESAGAAWRGPDVEPQFGFGDV